MSSLRARVEVEYITQKLRAASICSVTKCKQVVIPFYVLAWFGERAEVVGQSDKHLILPRCLYSVATCRLSSEHHIVLFRTLLGGPSCGRQRLPIIALC